ncbi:uncharacterized protein LOC126773444 [Nymphalis io]|uniref:uncharacterized protein LOC126773444 n=1 Tax=Inachis io TaxID=171585 RepID=UPI0021697C03|nr:uncharacterized protein LOC126773444 [Nymphalis io]
MKRIYQVIIFINVTFLIFLLIQFVEANERTQVHREKRYLTFRNISHLFVRFNFRDNVIPWNQLFAHAVGFRMNFDEPPDSFHPYHHLSRRNVYRNIEILLNKNGLDGFHCIRRTICEVNEIDEQNGIYFKILKMIFRQQSSETEKWHNKTDESCQLSTNKCPFSMLDVSPYTDV